MKPKMLSYDASDFGWEPGFWPTQFADHHTTGDVTFNRMYAIRERGEFCGFVYEGFDESGTKIIFKIWND